MKITEMTEIKGNFAATGVPVSRLNAGYETNQNAAAVNLTDNRAIHHVGDQFRKACVDRRIAVPGRQ